MYMCLCMCPFRDLESSLSKTSGDTDVQIVRYDCRKGAKDKQNHLTAGSPSTVSLRITGAQQLHQVKRMIGGIGNMLFSTYSQT